METRLKLKDRSVDEERFPTAALQRRTLLDRSVAEENFPLVEA